VTTLALDGNDLYVGMLNDTFGRNLPFKGIAKWNGSECSNLNGGTAGEGWVECIKVRPDGIYVAGEFTSIGGLQTFSVAKWDRSGWQALGSGLGIGKRGVQPVYALEFFGGKLYAGGRFRVAGDSSMSYMAMWDGLRWQGIPMDFLAGMEDRVPSVQSLAVWEGALYAAIARVPLYESSAAMLAKWDGVRWSLIEERVEGLETRDAGIREIAVTPFGLMVAGDFESLGNRSTLNLARWTGSGWSSLVTEPGLGLVAPVHRLVVDGARLYAGGEFMQAGMQRANGIAVMDKESWTGLSRTFFHHATGRKAHIGALAAEGGHVYVAGEFADTVNGLLNVGHWDGTRWDPMRSEKK
jgi:trimeric autotransporter adhesin